MNIKSATFVKSGTRKAHYPPTDLPEVAFAGRSNVGKSSLMNSMMRRKSLVRVSRTPGRTQILNWFDVNESLRMCDLPGYGFAKVPKRVKADWNRMVGEYLEGRESLLALIIITDVRRGFLDDDKQLLDLCHKMSVQPILVGTKCDKLKPNALYKQKVAIGKSLGADPERDIVWCSALSGAGRDHLWDRIRGLLPDDVFGD
ncbi:MAG: GTP-binding protein [Bradymonadia bacterium]|jgi:GTP-binding protein